ncbi:MAG: molybdopterin-dependent oxidoreductase [Nitrospirae bacterium]|nr:molybdopterin-dependent oxidoreductase [Nitrospirota bacterium]
MSRREFLQWVGAGSAGLALTHLLPRSAGAQAGEATGGSTAAAAYNGFQDLYRRKWSWDQVSRSTHFVNCWYQAHCAFDVYVKDGVVLREEQAGEYPQTNDSVPDFNPRGCQKGACYSQRMYEPTRVKYPLKRVGPRGSGKWKRISWEEALAEVADAIIDTTLQEGPDRIVWDIGPLMTMGTFSAGQMKLSLHLDHVNLDMNPEIGDGHQGAGATFGKIVGERSADDWFNSDLILIWGCNPIYTQIPNAHFLTEARYNGTRIVAITPDLNASAIKADDWITIRPGTDAALALAMCNVIVKDGHFNADFIVEQTDLALLVRDDNGSFLKESDLRSEGDPGVFCMLDSRTGRLRWAPRRSLKLGRLRPALEGSIEVATREGRVRVRPVFEILKNRLEAYTPEKVSAVTGVPADRIVGLARRIASAKAVCNVTSSNFCKYYHGNLVERSIILLLSLCGHMGRPGAGYASFPFLYQDGIERYALTPSTLEGATHALGVAWKTIARTAKRRVTEGLTTEMVLYEIARETLHERGLYVSGVLFWAVHGGLLESSGRSKEWDPSMKRDLKEILDESFGKRWQSVSPPPGKDPRILFGYGSNIMRRLRAYPHLIQTLLPKLKLYAILDWRVTSTTQWADLVLPAAGWYEKAEHKWGTPLMPFIHAGVRATRFYEAKSDWETCYLIAKSVRDRAKARGLETFRDRHGEVRRFETAFEELSDRGAFKENDEERVAERLIEMCSNLDGVSWADLRKKGFARFTSPGKGYLSTGNACEIKPNETVVPYTDHVVRKKPYPTATRRIQFYQDHPLYLEHGEALPVHKEPPKAGGDRYPLMLGGGHTRWSIHAAWRDNALMLRLQRGGPIAYVSLADARARGIRDGDEIEVFNDLNRFRIHAKLSPSLRPGQIVIYHAWENYQFKLGEGYQNLIPSPINPVELAGGQFHLRPMPAALSPGQSDRDTRVEIRRA